MMCVSTPWAGCRQSGQLVLIAYLFAIFLVCFGGVSSASTQGLSGNEEALGRVDLMLERIGGKALWAEARTLYVEEKSFHPLTDGSIEAKFWRDLEKPGEWGSLTSPTRATLYGWNRQNGWLSRDGEVRDLTQEEMEERNYYWHREIYTLYHQLAKETRDLTVAPVGINGFSVANEEGEKIGEFHLTVSGDLFFWQQFGGDDPVAYVYGPKKEFDGLSFPDWGGSTDGNWRFYYIDVKPSREPLEAHVSLARPESGP